MMVEILICTVGRVGKQTTYRNLPPALREITKLVVQEKEKEKYPEYTTVILPSYISTIGETRQYILDTITPDDNRLVVLDDDLVFATRRKDDPTKFVESTDEDVINLFEEIRLGLTHYALVGVSSREGANRRVEETMLVGRQTRIHGIRVDSLQAMNIRYDRIPLMEDFDVILQLLRQGCENLILNSWVHNQHGSGTSGGCSTYRTKEAQAEAANKLAQLHPGFVTVVTKQTKVAWGGQERTDVRVQWKKAYESAHHKSRIPYLLD